MKSLPLIFISAASILLSTKAFSEELGKQTVFLWPAKVEQCKGQPTEEVSPNNKGGVTRLSKILSPSITIYPAPASDKASPAILICPGGGYGILAIDKEGTEIADWCNSKGITGIVLKYSVPNMRAEALQDIQRAMGVIRQNAKAWNINPDQLGVMGFSAGGHLASRLVHAHEKRTYPPVDDADKLSCRPDFCMLIYPAWLEAGDVSADHPPTFIVQTKDDGFSKPTAPYVDALKDKKVPCEFHLFDKGGHGYGLRPSKNPVSKWPDLCEKWIKDTITTNGRRAVK